MNQLAQSTTTRPLEAGPAISTTLLADGLIRIGRQEVELGDEAAMDAYFAPDYVFHSPDGDLNLTQLKAFWVNLRTALTGLTITRLHVITEGKLAAARNRLSGKFDQALAQSAVGAIQPTGQPVAFESINTFRYDADGRLAEEWVQYDNVQMLKQFGINLLASYQAAT